MLDCFDKLVAYIPASCPCLGSVPENFGSVTETKIGLYLSDIMPTDFSAACGESTVWDTLKRLKASAKLELHQEVIKRLGKVGDVLPPWTGYIGNSEGAPIAIDKDYSGIKITLGRHRRGVVATIKEIMFWTGTDGDVELEVYDRLGNKVIDTQTITFNSGEDQKWTTKQLTTAIKLPMWSDDTEQPVYYIIWTASNVLGNDNGCISCSGTPPHWKQWFDVDGVSTNTPTNTSTFTATTKLNGIRPKITIECSFEDLLCVAGGNVEITEAVCLQYQWAVKVLEFILDSGQINKWTSLGGEYLQNLLMKNSQVLSENLDYLAKILYTGDCVKCGGTVSKVSMRI